MEEFRDVKGYEGVYQVSNLGNLRGVDRYVNRSNNNTMFVKGCNISLYCNNGYFQANLGKDSIVKTFKIHKLVAIAFLNHIPNGYDEVVDHIDNDSKNNNVNNLQLITQRENTSKDKKGCSSKYTGVSMSKGSNKWEARIRIDGYKKYLGKFNCELEASNAYQLELSKITKQNKNS